MLKLTVYYLTVAAGTCFARILHDVTSTTRYGEIVGRRHEELYDIGDAKITDTIDIYMGVPYAAPPIENLRLKPPKPPVRWQHTRDAGSPGPVCPQAPYYSQTELPHQSEDCLSLNIYTPYQNVTTRYPVMVYLHGGSYEEGAGSRYNGFTLAQHGVVIVTVNYRLGLLGYLSNGESSLPGNYGLLDQIEALRWISENIDNFRGDPCQITLFGNSAGSSSIGLLMLSPQARGLFHRVILQSGSPLAAWAVYNSTVDHGHFFDNVTDVLGCEGETTQERLDCLRQIEFPEFIKNYENFARITPSTAVFKPRVDGDILPDTPSTMFATAQYNNMTVLTGNVQNEWTRNSGWFLEDLDGVDKNFTDGTDRVSLEKSFHHVIESRFWWPKEVADAAMFEYTDWNNLTDAYRNRDSYSMFMSDLAMVAPTVEMVNILTKHGTAVYHYNFNHSSVHTDPAWFKCYHTLELDYVFGSPFNGYNIAVDGLRNHTDEDREVSRLMMKLWTNFGKFGKPTMEPVKGTMWAPVNSSQDNYLHVASDKLEVRHHLRAEQMAFWNVLVPKLLGSRSSNGVTSKARPTDMKLTLMWFFGILACLAFTVMLALVVRNGKIKKKLTKALAVAAQPQVV